MMEDTEGIIPPTESCEKLNLSSSELAYVNECIEGKSLSTLVDRIDELSPIQPPKAIDSNPEISSLIKPLSDQIDRKFLEAPSDLEQIKSISDYMSGVEALEYENWCELSPQERHQTLLDAEFKIAELEHREPCTITVKSLEPECYGYYLPTDKSITLNSLYVNENDFQSYKDTLDTLIHEGRHAYQDYNMTEREVHPREGEVNIWKWNENEIGYQDALSCGFKSYAMQPVETDARAFAEDVLNNYLKKV